MGLPARSHRPDLTEGRKILDARFFSSREDLVDGFVRSLVGAVEPKSDAGRLGPDVPVEVFDRRAVGLISRLRTLSLALSDDFDARGEDDDIQGSGFDPIARRA